MDAVSQRTANIATRTLIVAALAAGAALPATTSAQTKVKRIGFSMLLSKSMSGGFPNGPSRNAVSSTDQRTARYMAFESDASDIVPGDTNGLTDVFVVTRDMKVSSFDRKKGSPWVPNRTILASRGLGGRPADGRSYRPALDGDSIEPARCLAFISEASNLVRGDTNGVADAFVLDIRRRKISRVSVSSSGRQANGASYEVSLDGGCDRVAFSTGATNLGRQVNPDGRASRRRGGRRSVNGKRQVYVRYLAGPYRGETVLASASNGGAPGNGDSFHPVFVRKGHAVVFASFASNLAGNDGNGTADVFLRQLHVFRWNRALDDIELRTELISKRGGRAGNGPSVHSAPDSKARYVAFESRASSLTGSPHSQIVFVDRERERPCPRCGRPPRMQVVSKIRNGPMGNADSHRPILTAIGWFVIFDTDATNLRNPGHAPDRNGHRDVYKWYWLTKNVSLESRDHRDAAIEGGGSQNPGTNLHANYIPYESTSPRIDADVRIEDLPPWRVPSLVPPDLIAPEPFPEETFPWLHQAYLRYIGPCARTILMPDGYTRRCLLR